MASDKIKVEVGIANTVKGIKTCAVCGRDFALLIEDHYVARGTEKKGVIAAFSVQEEATLYDAIDCPHCGCQNILQERKRTWVDGYDTVDDCDTVDDSDFDGNTKDSSCATCKYQNMTEDEYPCNSCSHAHMDLYKSAEEDENE